MKFVNQLREKNCKIHLIDQQDKSVSFSVGCREKNLEFCQSIARKGPEIHHSVTENIMKLVNQLWGKIAKFVDQLQGKNRESLAIHPRPPKCKMCQLVTEKKKCEFRQSFQNTKFSRKW